MLNLIPLWAKALILAAIAAALVGAYAMFVNHQREIGRWEVRAEWQAEREEQKDAAIKQAAANAQESQRRLAAQQKAQHDHDEELAAYKRSVADAATALAGLRGRVADLTAIARRGASDTATVADRAAAGAATGMLADLSGRTDAAAEVYASIADASRRAGLQCEREYQSLTP